MIRKRNGKDITDEKLQAIYKDDKIAMQRATMELYQKEKLQRESDRDCELPHPLHLRRCLKNC